MAEDTNTPESPETGRQEAVREAEPVVTTVTVGTRLQAMREHNKLSLQDVAAQTQISKDKIDNIEKMNFDKPSVFLRGAVKTYAQLLGLPADAYAKEYIDALEGKSLAAEKKVIIEEPAAPIPIGRYRAKAPKQGVQVSGSMVGGAIAAVCAVGVIIWGLTGTTPPEPSVSKSVLAISTPQNGGDQSLMAEAGASQAATATNIDLSITALKPAWIEVRGADGTIFRSRKMAAGETYYPRLGSGWTVSARDGSAFEWRVEDVSVGKLSEEPAEVFAISVDQAARQAAIILAPPLVAGTGETQSVR